MKTGKAIGFAALAAGVLVLLAGDDEDSVEATDDGLESEDGSAPRVGFRAPQELVAIEDYEDEAPMCGTFYQVERGDIWLGLGKKSITWRALFRMALDSGLDDKEARSVAKRVGHRVSLANLIVASTWNDDHYGTWGYGPKSFVGEHGRAIPLSAVHADNRELMGSQQAPERLVERGEASWKGTGCCEGVGGASRPYLWIPQLNPEKLLSEGVITTEGIVWPGELSVLEPPPEVWTIGGNHA